jgi:hypothetical protein
MAVRNFAPNRHSEQFHFDDVIHAVRSYTISDPKQRDSIGERENFLQTV